MVSVYRYSQAIRFSRNTESISKIHGHSMAIYLLGLGSNIHPEQHLAEDGSKFVVFAGKAGTSAQIVPRPLRLTRVSPDVMYEIELKNREEASHLSRGSPALKRGPIRVSGAYLMTHGLTLPWSFPERMWVIEGKRL